MDVSERVLALMDGHNVKAAQLTKELSLSHGVITQWKQGISKPSSEALVKLADYFHVTTDYLLGRIDTRQMYPITANGKAENQTHIINPDFFKKGIDAYFKSEKVMSCTRDGTDMHGLADQFPVRYGLTKEKLEAFKKHEQKPSHKDFFRMLGIFEPYCNESPGICDQLLGELYWHEKSNNKSDVEKIAAAFAELKTIEKCSVPHDPIVN